MPNLFSRLAGGASNIAQRAGENLMPAPADGLLSAEDLQRARQQGLLHLGMSLLGDISGQGLGPALAQGLGSAQTAYQGTASDRMAQAAALKQKNILALRQQVSQKYAPQQGDTPTQMIERMPAMYMELMQAGDTEGAKQLQGVIEELAKRDSKPPQQMYQTVPLGDRNATFNTTTGQYTDAAGNPTTDLSRHQTREEIEDHALGRRLQEEQIAASRAARQQMMGMSAGNSFRQQNKDVLPTEMLYGNWEGAYNSSKSASPADREAAYKSAVVNYSRLVDPGQRSSLGMLHYLEQVSPSLVGRLHLTADKFANGKFPSEVLEAMNHHAKEIHRHHIKLYDDRRVGRLKAKPEWEQFLDPTDVAFPSSKTIDQDSDAPADGSRVNRFFQGWGR